MYPHTGVNVQAEPASSPIKTSRSPPPRPPTPSPSSPRFRDYHKHHYDHHPYESHIIHPAEEHCKRGVGLAGDIVGEVSRGLTFLTGGRRNPVSEIVGIVSDGLKRGAGEEPIEHRRRRGSSASSAGRR